MTCTNAHIWRAQAIAIAIESTSWTLSWGTKYWMPKEWGIQKPILEFAKDESWYWVIESDYDSQVVSETSKTEFPWLVRDISFWALLKAVFWSETSTAKGSPNTSVYDHVFTVLNTNNHPSLSVWAYDPVGTYSTVYNMVDSIKVSWDKWDFVKFNVSLLWKKLTSQSTPTVSYTTENNFLARHVNLYIATSEGWLDSATALPLENFELNINKNVTMTWIGLEPDCLLNQNFVVSWSFTSLYLNNTDWLALAQWATEKFFRISIVNSDVTIWTSANPTLNFTFAKAIFDEWDKSSNNNEIVKQTVWFVWHFNNTAGFSVKAKLSNTQSATY